MGGKRWIGLAMPRLLKVGHYRLPAKKQATVKKTESAKPKSAATRRIAGE
jgi:hypothetical protein